MFFKDALSANAVNKKNLTENFSKFNHCWDILMKSFLLHNSERKLLKFKWELMIQY